jgi:hypothetical protein
VLACALGHTRYSEIYSADEKTVSQVPQTISSEITRDINALIHESDEMRDWNSAEIQELFSRIGKLQKVDARAAFISFGALAGLCGDPDEVREYYRKALYLPEKDGTKFEFFTSMGNAGLYSEAQQLGSSLLDPRLGFFPKLWQMAMAMGLVRTVCRFLDDAKRLYEELRDLDFSLIEAASRVMQERQLEDKDIGMVLDIMGEVQRSRRLMFAGKRPILVKVMRPPEESPYLYLAMPLNAPIDEIHAMNREFARLVVRKLPGGAFPEGLVCSFAKGQALELRAAA